MNANRHHSIIVIIPVVFFLACFNYPSVSNDSGSMFGSDSESDSESDSSDSDSVVLDIPVEVDLPSPVVLPDPAIWYNFNGQVNDQVGEAHGVEVGAVEYVSGVDGLAGNFTGEEHVDASSFGETMLSVADSMTVSIRLKPHVYTGLQTIFLLGSVGDEGIDSNLITIQTRDGQVELYTETGDFGDDHIVLLGEVPSVDQWHNLVFVFDSSISRYYMDGEIIGEVGYMRPETTSTTLTFFSTPWPSNHKWLGAADDMQVFAEPLSHEQAIELSK